jgi:hypothetical protein
MSGAYAHHVREIERLMAGPTDPDGETSMLRILSRVKKGGLNYILDHVDLVRLFGDTTNQVFVTYRAKLLRLVSKKRVTLLEVGTRKALVVAMLRRCDRNTGEPTAIANILLHTRGKRLTELKNLIDADPDTNLHTAVYRELRDPGLRTKVLKHFAKQARKVNSVNLPPKLLATIEGVVIERDPGTQYVARTAIPGALQFVREIGRDAVLLTDRSQQDMSDDGTLGYVMTLFHMFDLPTPAIVPSGVPYQLQAELPEPKRELARASRDQYFNYVLYTRLFPEFRFVVLIDNAEDGIELGRAIVLLGGPGLHSLLIRDVGDSHGRPITALTERPALYRDSGLLVFDSYMAAAAEAYEEGLITTASLARIAAAATSELSSLRVKHPKHRVAAFQRDLELVNSKLPANSALLWDVLWDKDFATKSVGGAAGFAVSDSPGPRGSGGNGGGGAASDSLGARVSRTRGSGTGGGKRTKRRRKKSAAGGSGGGGGGGGNRTDDDGTSSLGSSSSSSSPSSSSASSSSAGSRLSSRASSLARSASTSGGSSTSADLSTASSSSASSSPPPTMPSSMGPTRTARHSRQRRRVTDAGRQRRRRQRSRAKAAAKPTQSSNSSGTLTSQSITGTASSSTTGTGGDRSSSSSSSSSSASTASSEAPNLRDNNNTTSNGGRHRGREMSRRRRKHT